MMSRLRSTQFRVHEVIAFAGPVATAVVLWAAK